LPYGYRLPTDLPAESRNKSSTSSAKVHTLFAGLKVGDMADIFLSYNREDQAVARRYAEAFEASGLSVWWDTTLRVGEAYDEVTEAALRGAKAVVVLWSSRSVVSRWVRSEATLANRANTLAPVMIEPCDRPIMFELTQTADLIHWQGNTDDDVWRSFIGQVRQFIGDERVFDVSPTPTGKQVKALLPRETLLAVMAFDNLSNDPELSYFSDGVSEEILYTVARAKGLRVIGKASSFQFRGSDKTTRNVAEALGATHMLDGSVRRSGDHIRISAELVDTASLETLWSHRFDRALTDIFALQDEIAAAIAEALDRHFSPDRAPQQVNPEAYDYYLQARATFSQDLSWAAQQKCIELLEKAIEADPNFADAWGALAIYRRGSGAIAAARHALNINPNCSTSHAALALNCPPFARHAEKLRYAERAYELAPDDQLVSGVYMSALMSLGYLEKACAVALANYQRNPLSPQVAGGLALAYRYAGRQREAIAVCEQAIKDFPQAEYPKYARGVIAIFDADVERAAARDDEVSAAGALSSLAALVGFMRAVAALEPEARSVTVDQMLRRKYPKSFLVDISLAGAVGEVEKGIEYLVSTIDEGRPLEFIGENDGRDPTGGAVTLGLFMPNFGFLRRDRRFAQVCVQLGLYEGWQELGRWPDCTVEIAPIYDLSAECAKLASKLPRYTAKSKAEMAK
jgi:TolB-like protein